MARRSGSLAAAASRSRSSSSPRTSADSAAERSGEIGPRREDRRLVLLQVAVVGKRQALDRREQTGQAPDRSAGLAACELGDIGVQLLRHHRRAGGGVLAEPGEAELRRRPEHELLTDPGEVDEADGRRVEVVEREVAVGDRVERVAELVRGRRQRQGRAGERTGAERARLRRRGSRCETGQIALEHLDPRQQVVPDRDWLSPLQVGVARHRRLGLGLGAVEKPAGKPGDRGPRLAGRIGHVEPERRRHLVVARPARVDLPADLSEQALDRGVDVLVLGLDPAARGDLREPRLRLGQLAVVEQPGGVQAAGVHRRRLAVVRQQLGVVGAEERGHGRVERAPDPAGPEGHAFVVARLRAAASSTSSDAILTKPSAAAWGNVSPAP